MSPTLAHPFLAESFVAQAEREIREIHIPNAETYVLEEDGKALVDHAFASKGPLSVEVFRDNAIGRRFYERYGFEFVADERHEPSGRVSRKMAMPGWHREPDRPR